MSSFDQAVEWIAKSNISTSTPTKLKLYSLYKIATCTSRPTTPRPGMLDFSGRAKWDAWNNLGKFQNYEGQEEGKETAKLEYVQEAMALGYREAGVAQSEEPPKRVENKEQAVSVSQIRDDFVDEAPLSKLHELSIEGDYPALEAFLSSEQGKASQIDQRDSYGYSALHLATDRGHTEIVKLLLAHGANGTATDEDGNTPLDLARLADHEELVNRAAAPIQLRPSSSTFHEVSILLRRARLDRDKHQITIVAFDSLVNESKDGRCVKWLRGLATEGKRSTDLWIRREWHSVES